MARGQGREGGKNSIHFRDDMSGNISLLYSFPAYRSTCIYQRRPNHGWTHVLPV
jgi:hypothetical protein